MKSDWTVALALLNTAREGAFANVDINVDELRGQRGRHRRARSRRPRAGALRRTVGRPRGLSRSAGSGCSSPTGPSSARARSACSVTSTLSSRPAWWPGSGPLGRRRRPTAPSRRAGRCVIPGFVDSHTHLVFAGDRVEEFTARMAGEPYAAGGILSTVAATRAASPRRSPPEASKLARRGGGSGHDDARDEVGLRTDRRGRGPMPRGGGDRWPRRSRFSGRTSWLRSIGVERTDYVALVTGPMLDACAPEAGWCDVFCEEGAFGVDAAREILAAGRARGLGLRVHANQLSFGPGIRLAVEMAAASADHCTHLAQSDLDALAGFGDGGDTSARGRVLHPLPLPGCEAAARCRGHGRSRHRLQSRYQLHDLDALRDRPRRA